MAGTIIQLEYTIIDNIRLIEQVVFFMEKQLKMNCDDAIEYVKDNVKICDNLELSYNIVYTPGEVMNVETECFKGKETCSVLVLLDSNSINAVVEVDLEEVKDDLIEIKHVSHGKNDTTVITIET